MEKYEKTNWNLFVSSSFHWFQILPLSTTAQDYDGKALMISTECRILQNTFV